MSISAAHADKFVSEVALKREVWVICDNEGFPTSTNASGKTVMPFWSAQSRAQGIIDKVPAYQEFQPHRLTLNEFLQRWLPGLERDGLLAGLNWSGDRATGYDILPAEVQARIAQAMI